MKKYLILILATPLLVSFLTHKYYLSVTDLEYNEEAQSIQMITRIFYDDLEDVLNERYDQDITISPVSDQEKIDLYLKKYLTTKIIVEVNNESKNLQFIGKEYEDDYVVCYLEIENIPGIKSFDITNELLMDLFPEQKNMLHTSVYGKKKSFLLIEGNAGAVLNFSE